MIHSNRRRVCCCILGDEEKMRRRRNNIRIRRRRTVADVIFLVIVSSVVLFLFIIGRVQLIETETDFSLPSLLLPNIIMVEALPDLKQQRHQRLTTKQKLQKNLRKTKIKQDNKRRDNKNQHSNQKKDPISGNKASINDDGCTNGNNNNKKKCVKNLIIESFLLPRRIPVRMILRNICILLMMWSLRQCIQTSGIPYAQTIWQLLEGDNDNDKIRKYYYPSPMDVKLAQLLLSCDDGNNNNGVMLPPSLLPSAKPLLSLVASIAMYVGLIFLIPRWSTKFRVLLDFRKLDSSLSSPPDPNTSVLVRRIGRSHQEKSLSDGNNDLLIIPLQQSSVSSKNKKKKRDNNNKKNGIKKSSSHSTTTTNDYIDDDDNYVHPSEYYFDVDYSRVYCNPDTKLCLEGAPTLQTSTLSTLQKLVDGGGLTKKQRKVAQERYTPYNTITLSTPTFREAFLERISSPLVVIQLVGKIISLLEEGTGAVLSMFITLSQHYMNARQAIVSATQLAQEVKTNLQDTSGYRVSVWNKANKKWTTTVAGNIIPGDIFRLKMQDDDDKVQKKELIVPVDALVLKGQCLTNEAILTGESVPQIKIPLDFDEEEMDHLNNTSTSSDVGHDEDAPQHRRLDIHKDRSSILFAGTTLFHTLDDHSENNDDDDDDDKNSTTGGGVTCIALCTGTYSSKGKLLQALKGSAHVGAISNKSSEKDAMYLISSLSFCSFVSCLSLFIRREGNSAKVSAFRRVIQCTRIVLASIPSDIPLALATIARSCSQILRNQADVVCSEPGSLLTAAYVDTVVFDKTGTLTADTQSLAKVVSTPSLSTSTSYTSEAFQRFVLAGCHSLVQFQENGETSVVGDPLDKAALQFSRWRYNQTSDSYFLPRSDFGSPHKGTEPVRLWQIRGFPFDPSRRLSSAIVLLQLEDSTLELWKLTKGSPDTMIDLLKKDSNLFDPEFKNQTQQLEMQGYRSITLGAENLSNSSIAQMLFPNGLSAGTEILAQARTKGGGIHRSVIDKSTSDLVEAGLMFCGFCCFDASTRPSSKRVVQELSRGGITCVMLTGDSVDAALSVARKVEIFKHRKIAVLERSDDSVNGEKSLVWRILQSKVSKDGSFRILHHRTKIEDFTVSSAKKFIKNYEKGQASIAANGHALELILFGQPDKAGRLIAHNLAAVSVIARATPELKKEVIEALKHKCGKRVMMCGDGVNDVAAIQSADVAASLLTGFGAESETSIDVDDERRMKRLDGMNIGSNRAANAGKSKKNQEANERIMKQMQKYHEETNKRVSSQDDKESESTDKQYTFQDVKDLISASMRAARDEQHRKKQLQKGGGDAARILAEERQNKMLTDNDDDNVVLSDEPKIKPGEASLVSSFSCLHPSVDGVDAIIREGIATAAGVLATTQGIGLHSLMTCFHLSTLYRDGFRYGKYMWNAELMLYQLLESARFKASCTPRPRLPNSTFDRPPTSMFQLGNVFGTVFEAIIHISCMTASVRYAKYLENDMKPTTTGGEERFKLNHLFFSEGKKLAKLFDSLSKRSLSNTVLDGENNKSNSNPFFQRPPFRPNYETNSVFIFSVLQSVISALVGHKGSPFYRGILESREFLFVSCITFLFTVICITGSMPSFTNFLDVKPLPSKRSKLIFFGISGINIIACVFCRWIMDRLSSGENNDLTTSNHTAQIELKKNAADREEELLLEETKLNRKGLVLFCGFVVYLVLYDVSHTV